MATTFVEYVNRKQRDAIRELRVVKRILKQAGLEVASHLHVKDDDPYLFIYNPNTAPEFGLRVYKLGGADIYFRPQKKEKTHPWGEAKVLDIRSMFEDISSEEKDEEKVAKQIIQGVGDEIKDYFKANAKAEKKHKQHMADKSPLGSVAIRGSLDVGDYSNVTYGIGRPGN